MPMSKPQRDPLRKSFLLFSGLFSSHSPFILFSFVPVTWMVLIQHKFYLYVASIKCIKLPSGTCNYEWHFMTWGRKTSTCFPPRNPTSTSAIPHHLLLACTCLAPPCFSSLSKSTRYTNTAKMLTPHLMPCFWTLLLYQRCISTYTQLKILTCVIQRSAS